MPKQYYIKDLNLAVIVEDNAFASGGEGELFSILSPSHLTNYVVKIFHVNKRDADKQVKIKYLIQNPPDFEGNFDEQPIVWVKYMVHDAKGEFVGFIMPKATGEKLEILTSPKLPKSLSKEWNRFRLGGDDALRLRLKVCYNLAAALRTIHATGKYVLVDLKPDNILIKSNGVVSIVDTDSIEVIEDGKTLFPATVATPEYTPAEYYTGTKPGKVVINASWDQFSLAVIYYRMLFGVHPFAATASAPYDNINALGDKIKHGLFVHNPHLSNKFLVVPPPHRKFGKLDSQLRKLFFKAFVDGFENPEARPSAEDWGQALMNNPLLLTNRPLPSKSLNLDAINDNNWYLMALEKAMLDQDLLVPPKDVKAASVATDYSSAALLDEAMGYYKQAGGSIWKAMKFAGLVLTVVMVLFIGATLISGQPINDISYAIDEIWFAIMFIPNLIIEIGGFTLFFFIALFPFILATFRQFSGMAKDKTQDVRKKMIGTFSFTEGQKKKSLEELQYTLYNQRTKVKQKLREIKNELIVLSRVKVSKEKEFYQKNNEKIVNSNREISSQLRAEKTGIQTQDEKAKELMIEEANAIKELRLSFQKKLDGDEVYAAINGKTAPQKIAFLEGLKNANDARYTPTEINQLQSELRDLDAELKEELVAIQTAFDEKHAILLGEASHFKIKIDDLVKDSVESMRQKTQIDSNLIDGSFKRLLKQIKTIQIEINNKESELEDLNLDIKELKNELKVLK